jgi:hypothetical protein
LYRSIVFPLRVKGQQGYVPESQQIPKYFISNIAGSLVAEVESIPQTPVVDDMVNRIYDLIPDVDARVVWSSAPRSPRGLINAV